MAKRAVKIPTYTQGAITPKENFVAPTPNIKSFTNIVDTVAGAANKIADAQAVQTAFEKGKKQQTESITSGSQNYLGDFLPALGSSENKLFQLLSTFPWWTCLLTQYQNQLSASGY